ncbi:hypothetical protein Tdes44962_MAKER00996 [Teratosphaeria destructans]|uniref:NTF2-like domain-containing protein n=1 Tax=Teratosphaeria destructans TaxID=418781 RepID=A0A9W7VYW4_9PEZI|nr:hypothetical protein Tdes44962_MAKER00996 [Teratosphaeria destructans]
MAALVATAVTSLLSVAEGCLTYNDAYQLATNFGKLVSNYDSELANQTLAPNFQDYSESVNSLMASGGGSSDGLLDATFSSRAEFETASSATSAEPFTLENVWYTCDTVTFRWKSDQDPRPVVGISVGHTVLAPFGNPTLYRFDEIWGEFDSAAWLTNLGLLQTTSQSSKKEKRIEMAFEA